MFLAVSPFLMFLLYNPPAYRTWVRTSGSYNCSAGCEYSILINQTWSQEPNGYTRHALVLVPASSSKLPVVIDIHGMNGYARTQRVGNFLKNSIIVAPQGYKPPGKATGGQWNVMKEDSKAPDTDFFRELFIQIEEIQQADMNDVTIIGTSNGGGMVYRLLIEIEAPRPFQRVIIMISSLAKDQYRNGNFYTTSNSSILGHNVYDQIILPGSPGPEVIIMQGTLDTTVAYTGGLNIWLGTFIGAQENAYILARAFGYMGDMLADSDGVEVAAGVIKYEYSAGCSVTHFKMIDMRHNGLYNGLYVEWRHTYMKNIIEGEQNFNMTTKEGLKGGGI